MSRPVAVTSSPTSNGDSSSRPPPGWPNTAPTAPASASPSGSAGRSMPGGRQHREVARRVEGDDRRGRPARRRGGARRRPRRRRRRRGRWSRRGRVAHDGAAAVLEPPAGAASTFTVDAATRSATSGVSPDSAGGGPRSGAGSKSSSTSGSSVADEALEGRAACRAGVGSASARAPSDRRRAGRGGPSVPGTLAIAGVSSHTATTTPTTPATAPPARSTCRVRPSGSDRWSRAAESSPSA